VRSVPNLSKFRLLTGRQPRVRKIE
jgi:hypothetical protein